MLGNVCTQGTDLRGDAIDRDDVDVTIPPQGTTNKAGSLR